MYVGDTEKDKGWLKKWLPLPMKQSMPIRRPPAMKIRFWSCIQESTAMNRREKSKRAKRKGRSAALLLASAFLLWSGDFSNMFLSMQSQGAAEANPDTEPTAPLAATASAKDDEILVRFRPKTSRKVKDAVHAEIGAQVARDFSIVDNMQLLKTPHGKSAKETIELYRKNPHVLYAEPNFIVHALTTPNDQSFSSLWACF